MSRVFLDELKLPEPDINLGVGSDTHARQTARIMMAFEDVLNQVSPDLVVVVGDVNSTLACSVVSQRAGVDLAHVEAGLRSGDRSMPEEINRVLTDQLSDWLYTSCEDAEANLLAEGIAKDRIVFAGNVMIDSLLTQSDRARQEDVLERFDLNAGAYALATLHRPSTVDDPQVFGPILDELAVLSERMPVIFPVHPRTRARLDAMAGVSFAPDRLRLVEPMGYHAFLRLTMDARMVITDSGGIQEETTYLGVPCLTVRENTERPVTITEGTNQLVGLDPHRLRDGITAIVGGVVKKGRKPMGWDGKASLRIAEHLRETYLLQQATETGGTGGNG
jgi:UDP-N-acetylglucosamine 2-epimerase (non-hydrolysing)